jgi:preprotein translocase subunit SecG
MGLMLTLVLVVQVLCALGVIVLVLLQHGKGADMGAAFGSGASGSLFGATGSANFLSRTTAVMAAGFFVCTLALAFLSNASRPTTSSSVIEQQSATRPAPAASTGPGDVPSSAQGQGSAAAGAGSAPAASGGESSKAGQASDIPK